MSRETKTEDTVLLLDEADSFVQDRMSAHQSWEVTQVNELLKQMDSSRACSSAKPTSWTGSIRPSSGGSISK